jgi:O-antigen/teichoic acid export membrane protein
MTRLVTTLCMIVTSALYVLYVGHKNGYTTEKSWIILWMCIFKSVDAIEDVYYAQYQQQRRLDIAGKTMFTRMVITIGVFALGVVVTGNLLLSLVVVTLVTAGILLIFINTIFPASQVEGEREKRKPRICSILQIGFPLFAGSFLAFYIGNAPKYAIDSILSDELQACYGFVAMPVFVIGLMNSFIYSPMVVKMSLLWKEQEIKKFFRMIFRQVLIIAGITLVCIVGADFLGIPVLSWLYNTDLAPYKAELLILLLGGGFLALSGFMVSLITIIRFQKLLVLGYGIVAVLAYIFAPVFVRRYSMMGAAVLYLGLMILLCLSFVLIFLVGYRRKRHVTDAQSEQ